MCTKKFSPIYPTPNWYILDMCDPIFFVTPEIMGFWVKFASTCNIRCHNCRIYKSLEP